MEAASEILSFFFLSCLSLSLFPHMSGEKGDRRPMKASAGESRDVRFLP